MIGEAPRENPAPSPGLTIRSGGADDLDRVMTVMESAFAPCFGESWTRSQCAGIMPMGGVELRLAGDPHGECIGFSLNRFVADEAELLLIAVAPSAQGRGIGQALIDDFIALADGHGATRLHLEVRDGNRAMSLYRANNFRLAGRRRDYYRGPGGELFDALTLARDL